MNITANVTFPPSPINNIFKTRGYGDPFMMEKMSLDTSVTGGNFQYVDFFTVKDWFKSVSVYQKLGRAELQYLVDIQPRDAASLESKMAFLVGERGGGIPPERPYWTRGGTWQDLLAGNTSILFEFGTMSFGYQLVKVVSENNQPRVYKFNAYYQTETRADLRPLDFYKFEGLRKMDVGHVTHASHPWLIQRCTWAGKNNTYHDTWNSGIVYHPAWSPLDYPVNNGSRELYIAREFLY